MNPVFPLPQALVRIANCEQGFPVHRIYCVGRNYADHAREMGSNPEREAPFFFSKPADAVIGNNSCIAYPSHTQNLHYEVELVVAIGKSGSDVSLETANDLIFGYAVGVDLTRRDLQNIAKQQARPWDMAKGFDHSAPIGDIALVQDIGLIDKGEIVLSVNDDIKQQGDIADLIWSVQEIIAELSTYCCLQAGDLIFTGTPAGVGALQAGDKVVASIAGLPQLEITIE